MTTIRTLLSIAALTTTTLATSGWAATDKQQDTELAAPASTMQVAKTTSGRPAMGMHEVLPANRAEQMKAMQEMHEKMLAAKTPNERNALMAAQMTLMLNGMEMMGGMGHMGGGAMMHKPADLAARQGAMEQRMEMMHSMMQMMMDRMPAVPAKN